MYAETESTSEEHDALREVRPAVLLHESESNVVPEREEGGLVPEMRSGVGEGEPTKKEIIARATEQYNAAARKWNELPGVRLVYPADKFAIKYCYCPGPDSKKKLVQGLVVAGKDFKCCFECGYPLKGEWDD